MKKILLSILLAYSCSSFAGQGCEGAVMEANNVINAMTFSQKVINKLDELYPNENQVILLGRIGQDLSKYNQKYSHGGYVYKDNGYWVIKHELNKCSTDQSSIYQEGIGNFFLDDVFKYEVMIISFKEPYNTQLLNTLKDNSLVTKMHEPKYNMLAYPFSPKYQNSNGWLIDTFIFSTVDILGKKIESREAAQKILKDISYKPASVQIGALTRLGARMTKANIAFDDQPFDERMAGHIQTVSFDGMINFFEEKGFIDKKLELAE